MFRLKYLLALLVAIGSAAFIAIVTRGGVADVILVNCHIWTGDKGLPWATSMAISKGRILRVGTPAFVKNVVGAGTEYLDLEGKIVSPGFIDSHVHFIPAGLQMTQLKLYDVKSRSHLERMVEKAAAELEDGAWILGSGWSSDKWGGARPTRFWIDGAAGEHPVWLIRVDGHMGLANTAALKQCHLLNDTSDDPEGGTIVRDEFGVPTGLLVDAAMELIRPCIPTPSLEERRAALVRASKYALSKGVTSVVDFGSYFPGSTIQQVWKDFEEVYTWADSMGRMSVRAVLYFPLETWPQLSAMVREKGHTLSSWIRVGGLKAFADGSLGSESALFHEPYVDNPNNFGLHVADPAWLAYTANAAASSGLQVAVHAIGDAANDELLSVFGSVISKNRHRIEHAQHLSPGAHARFSEYSVIASVQPQQLLGDASYASKKLGEERSLRSYNFRSLLANGTVLALGSDWPVVPLDPLSGILAAVKRTPPGWERPWIEEECISVADALAGYTISAAYAAQWETMVGSLEAGKMADFVVLSSSPFDDLASVTVTATYVGGVKSFPVD